MRNTKKQAFTLVELIVVITILAILGTIAFISLQGYSQDAKNSKVSSDLGTLASAIEISNTKGATDIKSILDNGKNTNVELTNSSTFGSGIALTDGTTA
jgi:prepilin-type N-terminal cleavage/methylation domain-containing protein